MKLYVYADHENRVVKIGVTENSAERRIREHMGAAAGSYRVVCETGHLDAHEAYRIESVILSWATRNGYQRAFGKEAFFGNPDALAKELCAVLERGGYRTAVPTEVRDSAWFRRHLEEQDELRRQKQAEKKRREYSDQLEQAKHTLEAAKRRKLETEEKLERLVSENEPLYLRVLGVLFGAFFGGLTLVFILEGGWFLAPLWAYPAYILLKGGFWPSQRVLREAEEMRNRARHEHQEADARLQDLRERRAEPLIAEPGHETQPKRSAGRVISVDDYNAIRRLAVETDDPERLAELAAKAHRYGFPGLASAIRRGKEFL